MSKFKIVWEDGEEEDELYETREEADDYARYLQQCEGDGAEILHMSNPGDYEYDENEFEPRKYKIKKVK